MAGLELPKMIIYLLIVAILVIFAVFAISSIQSGSDTFLGNLAGAIKAVF